MRWGDNCCGEQQRKRRIAGERKSEMTIGKTEREEKKTERSCRAESEPRHAHVGFLQGEKAARTTVGSEAVKYDNKIFR